MKHLIKLIVCVFMLLSLTACNKGTNNENNNVVDPGNNQRGEDVGNIGMPNPVKGYESLQDVNSMTGGNLVKPDIAGIEDTSFDVIDGEYQVGEYNFEADGNKYCFRFASVDLSQDISGLYYDGPLFSEDDYGVCFKNPKDGLRAVRWLAKEGQYCLSVEGNISQDDFVDLAYDLIGVIGQVETQEPVHDPKQVKSEVVEEGSDLIYIVYPSESDEYQCINKTIFNCEGEKIVHVETQMVFNTEDEAQAFFDVFNTNYPSYGLVIDGKVVSYVTSEDGSAYEGVSRSTMLESLKNS